MCTCLGTLCVKVSGGGVEDSPELVSVSVVLAFWGGGLLVIRLQCFLQVQGPTPGNVIISKYSLLSFTYPPFPERRKRTDFSLYPRCCPAFYLKIRS